MKFMKSTFWKNSKSGGASDFPSWDFLVLKIDFNTKEREYFLELPRGKPSGNKITKPRRE